MLQVSKISYSNVLKQVDEFRKYLLANNVTIHSASVFQSVLESPKKLVDVLQKGIVPDDPEMLQILKYSANALYLSSCILSARNTPFETHLHPRLKLLCAGDPRQLNAAKSSQERNRQFTRDPRQLNAAKSSQERNRQFTRDPGQLNAAKSSQERNRLFEVICACVLNRYATEVHFGSENPDILAREGNYMWGIECKSPTGKSSTVAKSIRKGINQIEEARSISGNDFGIVAVQATNHFRHNEMMPIRKKPSGEYVFGSFPYPEAAIEMLNYELKHATDEIERDRSINLKKNPINISTIRAILYVVNTLCVVQGMLRIIANCRFVRMSLVAGPEEEFCKKFNEHLQKMPSQEK